MSTAPATVTWIFPVLRAVPAAVLAAVITFTLDHSVALGFAALFGFALATAVVLAVGALRGGYPKREFIVLAALYALGAVFAMARSGHDAGSLLFVLSVFFAATGIAELVIGLRARSTGGQSRDWVFIGALGALLALGVLFIPAGYSQAITIPGKTVPDLTAATMVVGLLGAYAAIAAVYLVIAGLSLRWAAHPETEKATP